MSTKIIGTCSICSGPVSIPEIWSGVIAPIPACEQCGAIKRNPYGPVIEMNPRPHPMKRWEVKNSL